MVDARTFYGKGQIEETAREAKAALATLLVCDDELTGGQVNAIQKTTGLRVMDRTGLILAIFEQRARSQEAKVQVELARCEDELPRLKGAWTHLERQVGGSVSAAAPARPRSRWTAGSPGSASPS